MTDFIASLRRTAIPSAAVLIIAVAMMLAAGNLARYTIDLGTTLLIYLAMAQAWNLLAGFGGQFSLGVALFFGTGAYTTAKIMLVAEANALLTVVLAALAGGVMALLLTPALLRLRGDYFTIGSLAATLAVQAFVINFEPLGKSSGLDVPFASLPSNVGIFQLGVSVAAVATLVVVWTKHSKGGLQLLAVGQDQDAAVGVGVNVFRLRLVAFALSGMFTAAAGAILALHQIHVEPVGTFSMNWTITVILMTIVGGIGTILGPVFGVVAIYLGLTQQLDSLPVLGLVIQGLVLIAVVKFAPRGLWPLVATAARRLRPPRSSPPESSDSSTDPTADTVVSAASGSR